MIGQRQGFNILNFFRVILSTWTLEEAHLQILFNLLLSSGNFLNNLIV